MPGPGAHLLYALSGGVALSRLAWPGRFGPAPLRRLRRQRVPRPGPRRLRRVALLLPALIRLRLRHGGPRHGRRAPPLLLPAPPRPPARLGLRLALPAAAPRRHPRRSFRGSIKQEAVFLAYLGRGSLSHFFLDHLFEENGHSIMYTWILSTGWWKGRAPINPDAVFVVGLLCICLMGGFVYINRVKHGKSITEKSNQSFFLILVIATLYCMWCGSQMYLRQPPQPAIGEEADLGVIIFLAIYLFLPNGLCAFSMNQKDYTEAFNELPLR